MRTAGGGTSRVDVRRLLSWALIGIGVVVILASAAQYGWAVFATNTQTEQAQQRLLEQLEANPEDNPTVETAEPVPSEDLNRPPPGLTRPEPDEDGSEPAAETLSEDGWAAATTADAAPEAQTRVPPERGEPVAKLSFARPGEGSLLTDDPFVVVEGIGDDQLALGPGRYPSSAMPGDPGMVAIAGHRVTHGAPFYELDILESGDEIRLETDYGSFVYEVTDQAVVDPEDTWVLDPEHGDLVLTTCHPRMSDRQRLVVWAKEVTG